MSVAYKEDPTHFICVTVATCNKPVNSTSANTWTSFYSWNTNGTLASVQLPLISTGNRPETDYTYTQYGTFSLLTGKTQYISRSPTVTTTTSYAYNAANHYVPLSVTVDPTGLNLTTTLAYDAQGDVTSVKGPRTDVDTTSYFTYDADRQNLFAIQPDQDAGGSHPRVATLKTYDDAGHLIETDRGTTTSITGSPFTVNNWVKDVLDPDANKMLETTGTGSSGSAVTTTAMQYTYDGANRVLCTAQRMNPGQYTTLPSDACTLGPAGSYGQDRITQMIYDAAGQVRQEVRALDTNVQQVYATHKYEPDGKEIAIADSDAAIPVGVSYAEALNATAATTHQTNYAYDGFDRLITTTYADGTTDRVANYDNDGNVIRRRTRANDLIQYTYDTNDRMATKAVPASGTIPANTVNWTYDLMNEVTSLTDSNNNAITNCYDLANRLTSATQSTSAVTAICGTPLNTSTSHTVSYAYNDGAGDKVDRSQIAWPDGWFVNYNYDALGHMTSATDSDGVALATKTYDDYARPATTQYPQCRR